MIVIKIPKDIREYKEKIFMGLTARQILSVVLAVIICVPTYFFGRKYVGDELISWIVILIAVPIGAIGFVKKNGMPFEKYFITMINQLFIYPNKVSYKSRNFYRDLIGQYEKQNKIKKNRNKQNLKNNPCGKLLLNLKKFIITGKSPDDKENKNRLTAEEVERKRSENPNYIPSKSERKRLLSHSKEIQKIKLAELNQDKIIKQRTKSMVKRRTPKSNIPKSTQDDLPYIADFEEGLFEVEEGKYSKCYEFNDINYFTAKEEDSTSIFIKWTEFLNFLSEDIYLGIYIDNHIISPDEQERRIFYQKKADGFNIFREEFNKLLKRQMSIGRNDIIQKKYITLTVPASNPYEALLKFRKIDSEVNRYFNRLGSRARVMTTEERLAVLHDKMRKGREGELNINFDFLKFNGISSKDYVAPTSLLFGKNYFLIEDTYHRCMFVNNLPASLSDEFVNELADCEFPVTISISVQSIEQNKALNMVRRQLTGMEANKIEAEKKAIRAGYGPETISHDLKQSLTEAEELLDDMINKDQKLFYVSVLVMISADSYGQLNDNAMVLRNKVRSFTCQLQDMDNQQRESFKICMFMGVPAENKIFVEHPLTTESAGIFIPFANEELFEEGGSYYGINQRSRNLILLKRTSMKTPSGFVLGSSGSGKSFAAKKEIVSVLLEDDKTNVFIIDPDNEYGGFAKAFNATVFNISSGSEHHLNAFDMDINYGLDEDDDPNLISFEKKKEKALRRKTEYFMSTGEQIIKNLLPQQKSIIDRVVERTYQEYINHDFDEEFIPTYYDFQKELNKEKSTPEGRALAESWEYFTIGKMNIFSYKTNIDLSNRFIVFNLKYVGKELRGIASMTILDIIWNKMVCNALNNIRTVCYVDEIHLFFRHTLSEEYLQQLYKRGRKFGLIITGLTQDVEEILRSETGRTMINNSDFIIMLNQKGDNLNELMKLLNISETQATYLINAEAGSGLIFAEKTIVPFTDDFPKDSYLYKLMSTKFGEKSEEQVKQILDELRTQTEEELQTNREIKAG